MNIQAQGKLIWRSKEPFDYDAIIELPIDEKELREAIEFMSSYVGEGKMSPFHHNLKYILDFAKQFLSKQQEDKPKLPEKMFITENEMEKNHYYTILLKNKINEILDYLNKEGK